MSGVPIPNTNQILFNVWDQENRLLRTSSSSGGAAPSTGFINIPNVIPADTTVTVEENHTMILPSPVIMGELIIKGEAYIL